jgi:serine phosphatase RsbU (regulator of sigma subunit)
VGWGVSKLFRKGTVTELRDYGGFVLGGIEDTIYTEGCVKLNNGDIVVIATDGLEEVKDHSGKRLGTEWLDGFMATCCNKIADDRADTMMATQIEKAIHDQSGCRLFLEDDIACVCIEYKGNR